MYPCGTTTSECCVFLEQSESSLLEVVTYSAETDLDALRRGIKVELTRSKVSGHLFILCVAILLLTVSVNAYGKQKSRPNIIILLPTNGLLIGSLV